MGGAWLSYGRRRPISDEGAQVSHRVMGSIENWGVKPVRLLRLRGHLMRVVDSDQWSAGEASAIAEVALPKLPFKVLKFHSNEAVPQHPLLIGKRHYE